MSRMTRRRFLHTSVAAAAAFSTVPHIARAKDPNGKLGVAIVGVRGRGGTLAPLAKHREPIVFQDHVLDVRRLAIVLEEVAPADAGDRLGTLQAEQPVDRVERVLAEVGHLSAGGVPEPAEMIDAAIGVVRPLRRRAEPQVPVEFGWRGPVGRIAEPGAQVAAEDDLDARDLADLPGADRLAGALGVFAGPRLRADLHMPRDIIVAEFTPGLSVHGGTGLVAAVLVTED